MPQLQPVSSGVVTRLIVYLVVVVLTCVIHHAAMAC